MEPARVVVDQVGLNHLTWVRAVRLDGADVLADAARRARRRARRRVELPRRLLDELGAVPSYYLRYFYAHDACWPSSATACRARPRSPRSSASCSSSTATPRSTRSRRCSSAAAARSTARPPPGSCARSPGGDDAVHVVDIRNDGTLAGLADDDVVEVPGARRAGRLVALPQAPLAPELLGLVQHVAAYERLAARAAVTATASTARKALLAHPLIGQDEIAGELLERLRRARRWR